MNKPTLSVVMANYNYGQFIREALTAIVTQSYQPMELIVVDDASTDNSVAIINEFLSKYPYIRLIRNDKNIGGVNSVDNALQVVKGDYFYSASSDDKIFPGMFEKAIGIFSEHPEAGMFCADHIVYDGRKYYENKYYLSDQCRYFTQKEACSLLKKSPMSPPFRTSTAMLKSKYLKDIGGYDQKLGYGSDVLANTIVALRYGFCYCPEPLVMVRMHNKQIGQMLANTDSVERENIKNMMNKINDDKFRDVASYFKLNSAVLSIHPMQVMKVVIKNRQYRDYLSVRLLYYSMFDMFIVSILLKFAPIYIWRYTLNKIRNIYRNIFDHKKS